MKIFSHPSGPIIAALLLTVFSYHPAGAALLFGSEQAVQAGGADITVPGYSVPALEDWNEDGLADLIVGEGGLGVYTGKVRVYLNQGSPGTPVFVNYSYVQSGGVDLQRDSGG